MSLHFENARQIVFTIRIYQKWRSKTWYYIVSKKWLCSRLQASWIEREVLKKNVFDQLDSYSKSILPVYAYVYSVYI